MDWVTFLLAFSVIVLAVCVMAARSSGPFKAVVGTGRRSGSSQVPAMSARDREIARRTANGRNRARARRRIREGAGVWPAGWTERHPRGAGTRRTSWLGGGDAGSPRVP